MITVTVTSGPTAGSTASFGDDEILEAQVVADDFRDKGLEVEVSGQDLNARRDIVRWA